MLKLTLKIKIVASAIIVLIFIGLLSVISSFLLNSKIDCKTNPCAGAFRENRVIQYIEFSFVNKSEEKTDEQVTNNSIKISRNQNNLVFNIPQLKPESSNLQAEVRNIQDNSKIKVIINQSRSIYIFVDEKVAFTHRYEMPVFQINPNKLVIYDGIDSSTQNITANYLVKNPELLETSRILLVLMLIMTVTFLLSLTYQTESSVFIRPEVYKPFFIFGVAFFWIVSLLVYFIKPFDPVGAQNPGLFGPIGAAFSDYFQIAQISQFNKPYELGGVNYPPASLIFGKIMFYALPGLPGFILFASASLGFIFKLVRQNSIIKSPRTLLLFIFFYPLIFGLVRGNFDIVAVCLVFYSINFIDKFNGRISILLLAFAIAIKIWPIVFVLYFYKWKNKKLVYETLIYTIFITLFSAYLLGYSNLDEIFEVISSSLFSADNVTTQAFHYCYSVTAIIFFAHLFVTADSPWNPLKSEIQSSVMFTDGFFAKFILLCLLLLLVLGVFKTRSKKQTFLFLSGIALLLPTPSYTYRGAVLLGSFILFSYESLEKSSKNSNVDEFFRKIQLCMWIPIFAPSTFFFARNSEISTASFIQPLSLLIILGIELYLLFSQGSYFQRRRPFSRIEP
jgi:hypothetical protein